MRFESLESRAMLAIVGWPAFTGNQFGNAISLAAFGPDDNALTIELDETINPGSVTATINGNQYFNFNSVIKFTGTADWSGVTDNAVTLRTRYGVDLVGGSPPFGWVSTCDFTPVGLPDVTVSLTNADSLTVENTFGSVGGPSSIVGTFHSPTLVPPPGATIDFNSSGVITVLAAGVDAYDLTLDTTVNGFPSAVVFNGPVTVSSKLTVTSKDDISIDQPLTATAGGTISVISSAGDVFVNKDVTADGAITLQSAAESLTVDALVTSVVASVTLSAGTWLEVNQDVTANTSLTAIGVNGITTDAAADLLAATGGISLTSASGFVQADGSLVATAGAVTVTAGNLAASTAKVTALTGLTVTANTNATLGGPTTITGTGGVTVKADNNIKFAGPVALLGTGDVLATADAGSLTVLPLSPMAVTNGKIGLQAVAGTVKIESKISSNLDMTVDAAQGVELSNAVDPAAALLVTGPLQGITVTTDANQILVDAPVTALDGAVTITAKIDDIVVRDDIYGLDDVKVAANTTLVVNGVAPSVVTVTSDTGTLELTSTTSSVTAGPNLVIGTGFGATAGVTLTAATVVNLSVPVTANGAIAITSPDVFTVIQPLTSLLDGITIVAANGPITSVVQPLTAATDISLTALTGITLDNTITSTGGGISVTSAGGTVTMQPGCTFVAPSVLDGSLAIEAGTFVMGNDIAVGSDISVKTATAFTPLKDFTSTVGDITILVTGAALSVAGSTLTAGDSVTLSALGAVTYGVVLTGPAGSFTVTAGGTVTPTGPIVVGGSITISTGGTYILGAGDIHTAATGDITITATGLVDVTKVPLTAPLGSISLTSETGSVLVGAAPNLLTVDLVAGSITLDAPMGVVTVGQALVAGKDISISSLGPYTATFGLTATTGDISITTTGAGGLIDVSTVLITPVLGDITLESIGDAVKLNGGSPLTAVGNITVSSKLTLAVITPITATTGDVTLASTAGDVEITKALFAGGTLSLEAFDEINNGGSQGPVTTTVEATTFVALSHGTLGKLQFTNPSNNVVEATLEMTFGGAATGAGVTYIDADSFTVNSVISALGNVSLTSIGGGIVVVGGIGVSSGETLTDVALLAPGPVAIGGNVVALLGDAVIASAGASVAVTGSLTSSPTGYVDVDAGDSIVVTGSITGGADDGVAGIASIDVTAGNLVNLGTDGVLSAITSVAGTVRVTAVNGITVEDSKVTALQRSIRMVSAGKLSFDGGELNANTAYSLNGGGLDTVGLVELVGPAEIKVVSSPIVRTGRLEIVGAGVGAITLSSPLNDVDTLQVNAGGNFTYYQELGQLAIDDPDDLANATVQVKSASGAVSITSLAGLKIVDGIEYNTTLSLVGRQAGAEPGVEFYPTQGTDNPDGGGFKGTLRDMLNYVNANIATNTAGTGNTPMRVVFDDPLTPTRSPATVTVTKFALPTIAKTITFDGLRTDGSRVEIDGNGVPIPTANGLTLGTASSGSVIQNAHVYGFGNAGVAVTSGQNILRGLELGLDASGNIDGNGKGILLTGPLAVQNIVGIRVNGDPGNTIVGNGVGLEILDRANYTTVQGNFISNNVTDGIAVVSSIGTLVGSTTSGLLTNVVVDNGRHGVYLENVQGTSIAYGATVQGNTITGNGASGVQVTGGGRNLVGGTSLAAGNTISGNRNGVRLDPSLLPTPVNTIHVYGNTISDNTEAGVHIQAGYASVVSGNKITGNDVVGVRIESAVATKDRLTNFVVSNTVSTNGNPLVPAENEGGIIVLNSRGQSIGVDTKGQVLGNTLAGNYGSGIVVLGNSTHTQNAVLGNSVTGSKVDGIRVAGAVATVVRNNTSTGNSRSGIAVVDGMAAATTGNFVQRNVTSGNQVGIQVAGSRFTQVGGVLVADGNFVHSNTADGIRVESSAGFGPSQNTVIRNNAVGVSPGASPAGNAGYGISITESTGTVVDYANLVRNNATGGIRVRGGLNNTIGSAVPNRANTIATNTGNGITIQGHLAPPQTVVNVTVAGNLIESNTGHGILVSGPRANSVVIGRVPSISQPNGTGNTIRDNTGFGIRVDAANNVTMIGNSLSDNDLGLISLVNGANGGITAPTSLTAKLKPGNMKNPMWEISGRCAAPSTVRYYVDIYMDSTTGGQVFMGRVLVTGGSLFRVTMRGPATGTPAIRATATAASGPLTGGTSAFSAVATIM